MLLHSLLLGVLLLVGTSCQLFSISQTEPIGSGSKNSSVSATDVALPVASKDQRSVLKDPFEKQARLRVNQVIRRFAIGSCMDQNEPQPVWSSLLREPALDLFIAAGDIVYASSAKDKPITQAYQKQRANPDIQAFQQQVPWIGVWDDHDFGVNDGGGPHPELEEARQQLLTFLPNSALVIDPNLKGVYHSFIIGNKPQTTQFILLDTRTFRSPLTPDTSGQPLRRYQPTTDRQTTLLGEEQWRWLENELQRPANVRFLVSSIQVIPEEHGFEKWANFPHEREKLWSLLKKYKINNLFIISGDRHLSEISEFKLPKKQRILEITASGLNKSSQLAEEINRYRKGKMILQSNYTVIETDFKKRQIIVQVKSVQGDLLREERFGFKK